MLESLGKYEIRKEIGRGAMGTVYEGFDPAIGRRVAIKTLRTEVFAPSQLPEVLERFKREAQSAGRLSHPHVVTIHEYGEEKGTPYIVMEFMSGTDLGVLLGRGVRFSLDDIVRIMTQLLGALEIAHENGVVHRDLKPSNMFLLQDGSLKVVDFGIAHVEASELTQTGATIGTPAYMSPEQVLGIPVNLRSDIFSAGVVLYQLLTGDRPFGGSAHTISQKILHQEPLAPSSLNPMLSPSWDIVVSRAMAKKPTARYESARHFSEAIKIAAQAERANEAEMIRKAAEASEHAYREAEERSRIEAERRARAELIAQEEAIARRAAEAVRNKAPMARERESDATVAMPYARPRIWAYALLAVAVLVWSLISLFRTDENSAKMLSDTSTTRSLEKPQSSPIEPAQLKLEAQISNRILQDSSQEAKPIAPPLSDGKSQSTAKSMEATRLTEEARLEAARSSQARTQERAQKEFEEKLKVEGARKEDETKRKVETLAKEPAAPIDPTINDRALWGTIDQKNPEELSAYIAQFPNGLFTSLAQTRLKALQLSQSSAASASGASAKPPSYLASKWDLPTPYSPSVFHTENTQQFANDVERGSSGKLRIQLHSNGSLMRMAEIKRGIQNGQVQAGEILLAAFANEDPIFELDGVPFLVASYADAMKLYKVSRRALETYLAKQGIKLLYSVPWPPQGLFTRKEIRSVADLRGLKWRAYSPATAKIAELAGAQPVTIQQAELLQAMASGVVDSYMSSPATGYDTKTFEHLKFFADLQGWIPKNAVLMNQSSFNSLDRATQEAILKAAADAEVRGWRLSEEKTGWYNDQLKRNGMSLYLPSPQLRSDLKKIGDVMIADWARKAGPEGKLLLDAYLR